MKRSLFLIPLITVLMLALVGCEESPEQKAKSHDRSAIKECWKSYDKKSLPDDQKRFIASACEMMEGKFKEKYGVSP